MIRKFYDIMYDGGSSSPLPTKYTNETEKEIIECECGTHLLKVVSDVDITTFETGKKRYSQTFYMAMFYYGIESNLMSFSRRLKLAWKIIKTGKNHDDQMCLTPLEAIKLSEFIKENAVCDDGERLLK